MRTLILLRRGLPGFVLSVVAASMGAQAPAGKRTVTVPDMIRMTTIDGNTTYGTGVVRPAVFSRDGRLFAIIVRRGDLERNLVTSSILVFRTGDLFARPRIDTVLTFASSSNRPAISNLQWMAGDSALTFLGERPNELPQVYALNLKTRAVQPVTQSGTVIDSYNLAPNGERVVYIAAAAPDSAGSERRAAQGFVVTQEIRELFDDKWGSDRQTNSQEIFAVSLRDRRSSQVRLEGLSECSEAPKIAATGRYAVMRCALPAMPPDWRRYEDGLRGFAVVPILTLVDLERGTAAPFFNAPWYRADAAWSPDGAVVIVRNTLLPVDGVEPAERDARRRLRATVAIDPATRAITVLARRDSLEIARWDQTGQTVVLRSTGADKAELAFRRAGASWTPVSPATVPAAAGGAAGGRAGVDVVVEQDLNTPPRIVATGPGGQRAVVLDPNPQFAELAFGREVVFRWKTVDGEWEGGLYYPVGFTPGKRYPLVVQTHGFSPDRFQIEGYAYTGYAGQALAGRGIMVLQVGDGPFPGRRQALSTPEEGPFNNRGMEAAIDTLDKLGLIDRNKVGLEGWSRTTYHVRHMLTHSTYPIAAALISDGVDFSYLRYIIDSDLFRNTGEIMNGGIPIGDTLRTWRERVPTLNPDKITTPIRIESIPYPDGGGPLTQWELFTLLKRLNKPVELVYYPRGQHNLTKPWERLTSQEGAFDWFRFWLSGEEDPGPAKAAQYERWRAMRGQQSGAKVVP